MEIIKIVYIFTTLAASINARQFPSESSSVAYDEESLNGDLTHTLNDPKLPETTFQAVDKANFDVVNTVPYNEPFENKHGSPEALTTSDDPQNSLLFRSYRPSDEDCICNRRGHGRPVSEKLNPEGDDLQRVVIYLYSKKSDPKVHLYIPNVKRQHEIPDLPIEESDLLKPLDTDFLLKLLVDSPYSVTKKVFNKRPDYNVQRIQQPDVTEFKMFLTQVLVTEPKPYESLAKIVRSTLPKKTKKRLLKFLHSLGSVWDGWLSKLKNINNNHGEVFDYEVNAQSDLDLPTLEQHLLELSHFGESSQEDEPELSKYTLRPSYQDPVNHVPTSNYEGLEVVPTNGVHQNFEILPADYDKVLYHEEPNKDRTVDHLDETVNFMPSTNNIPVNILHSPVNFPGLEEQERLPYPIYSNPKVTHPSTYATPYVKLPPSDYPENAPTTQLPDWPNPTATSPLAGQEKPLNLVFPTKFPPDYDNLYPVVSPSIADSQIHSNKDEKFLPDALPYPWLYKFPTFDRRHSKSYPDYEANFPVENLSFPHNPTTLPTFDGRSPKLYPDYGEESPLDEYPSDARPYPTRPARLPIERPNQYKKPSAPWQAPKPFQWEDSVSPYQSKDDTYSHNIYGKDGKSSHSHVVAYPYDEDKPRHRDPEEYRQHFAVPSYEDKEPEYEWPAKQHEHQNFMKPLDFEISSKWTQAREQEPNLLLNKNLTKLLLQPKRLSLIIKYLQQIRNNPYVLNYESGEQPERFDLILLQQLLNPEVSYDIYGRSVQPTPLTPDPTFEKWFKGQVVDLGTDIAEINVDSLRILIEGILRDNHIVFTKEGLLVNKFGNTMSVGELKLRPILIGNSVDVGIKTLLDGALHEKIKIAHESPYLHGLLVSFGTPPHVLGLIPLGYKPSQGKLPVSGQSYDDGRLSESTLVSDVFGQVRSVIQEQELPEYNDLIKGSNKKTLVLPGKTKLYSWTSPTHTIKYRPQIVRRTFKNVPLDKKGFQNFLDSLKQSGFGDGKIQTYKRKDSYEVNNQNSIPLETNENSDLSRFGQRFVTVHPTAISVDEKFDQGFDVVNPTGYPLYALPSRLNPEQQVSLETSGKFDIVHPTGEPRDYGNSELDWFYSKPPKYRPSGSDPSLSLNAEAPNFSVNGNLDVSLSGAGAKLASRFSQIDLSQLGGILKSLPNVATPDVQAGDSDAAELNNVADLVLSKSSELGGPGAQVNVDLGAELRGSLDGLLPAPGSINVQVGGSDVKVPAGVGKDFEFTEYPVEQAHAAADTPEFRIIGGNAATGSGTPLSNKGKSGVIA